MLLLERPKTFPTLVNQTFAQPSKKLTAKWIKVDQELVCQWVVE